MGDLQPAREDDTLQVQHKKKSCTQCDDTILISAGDAERSGWEDGYALHVAVLCERCSSTLAGVGNFLEEKIATLRSRAEYLVGEDVLVTINRQVHFALDQVSAHADRCDADSFIRIEAALGGVPQRNVTSVESAPGVLAGRSKRVQGALSENGHERAEGSDMRKSYCGDSLAERDLDVGQLELEFHTSVRQRSCGTQAARRLSAAHDASTRLE